MSIHPKVLNRLLGVAAAIMLITIPLSGTVTGFGGILLFVLGLIFLVVPFLAPCSQGGSCQNGACEITEEP